MKKRELINLGLPAGDAIPAAFAVCAEHRPTRDEARTAIARILADPAASADDPVWGPVARALMTPAGMPLRAQPAPLARSLTYTVPSVVNPSPGVPVSFASAIVGAAGATVSR